MTKDLIEVVAREAGRRKFRRVGMGPSLKRHKHELQMPALPPLLPIIPTAAIITTTPSKGCSAAGQPSALQPLPSLSSSPQHEQQPREEGLVLLLRRQRLRIPAIACMSVGVWVWDVQQQASGQTVPCKQQRGRASAAPHTRGCLRWVVCGAGCRQASAQGSTASSSGSSCSSPAAHHPRPIPAPLFRVYSVSTGAPTHRCHSAGQTGLG